MKNLRAARRYAVALMAEAEYTRAVDAIADDLELIGGLFKSSRDLRRLSTSPIVSVGRKTRIFDELLGKHVSKETLGFIRLLISKHRESLLPDIVDEFVRLRDEKQGIVPADVRSAIPLTASEEKALREKLERYAEKKVRLGVSVEPELRGGLRVRIGDTVLDASIKRQLELLRECLVGASRE